jgi:hypothetical protein
MFLQIQEVYLQLASELRMARKYGECSGGSDYRRTVGGRVMHSN